jgi:hypothetical protein
VSRIGSSGCTGIGDVRLALERAIVDQGVVFAADGLASRGSAAVILPRAVASRGVVPCGRRSPLACVGDAASERQSPECRFVSRVDSPAAPNRRLQQLPVAISRW